MCCCYSSVVNFCSTCFVWKNHLWSNPFCLFSGSQISFLRRNFPSPSGPCDSSMANLFPRTTRPGPRLLLEEALFLSPPTRWSVFRELPRWGVHPKMTQRILAWLPRLTGWGAEFFRLISQRDPSVRNQSRPLVRIDDVTRRPRGPRIEYWWN